MEKNNIQQDQIDQGKQETHAVRHLRSDRAARGGKYQGRHGEEECCRQGGDLTDVIHLEAASLLIGILWNICTAPVRIRSIPTYMGLWTKR